MKIDAIRELEPESQRQIAEWIYQHIAALSKAQARFMMISLVTVVIALTFVAEQPEKVGFGDFTVTKDFFLSWFPAVLVTVAWGLMGSLVQMKSAWSRLLTLLDLQKNDLGIYDIDPKPSLADHVTFLPNQLKNRILAVPLKFVSSFFYDLAYLVPIGLSFYLFFGVFTDSMPNLGTKINAASSIVFLIASVPATFFACLTFWRRQIRKVVDWV